jgi:fucose 4-O-acetylase-like acetyltransferase
MGFKHRKISTLATAPQVGGDLIEAPSRYAWIDTAKGLGIVLVVLEHVLRSLIESNIEPSTPLLQALDEWIYTFHMPLFFFLAGILLYRSSDRTWRAFAWEKVRTIAYPYFVWSTITIFIKAAIGRATNHPYSFSDLPRVLYQPVDQFWFLYALFFILLAIAGLLRLGVNKWVVLLIAVAISPAVSWLVISDEPIARLGIRTMALYAALGMCIGSRERLRVISFLPTSWLVISMPIGLMLAFLPASSAGPMIPKALMAPFALGGIAGVLALSLLLNRAKIDRLIQFFGRHSLAIFLIHTIAAASVRITLLNFAHVRTPWIHLLLGSSIGLMSPIAAALLFERMGFGLAFAIPKELSLSRCAFLQSWCLHQGLLTAIGAILSVTGPLLWSYGYFVANTPPLFDWAANTPWWIANFVPTFESEIGVAMMLGSMILVYWSHRGTDRG